MKKVSERDWVHGIVPLLQDSLGTLDAMLVVEDGRRLAYAREILRYSNCDEPSREHGMRYETDLLISERFDDGTWIPRVVVEAKLGSVTTHDAITYSQKAGTHKQVHPYLRYGILLGDRGHYPLPGRLFRHGAAFDFMLSWQGFEPVEDELPVLTELLHAEVVASRMLEDIVFNTRARDRSAYTVLHRPLVLRGGIGVSPTATRAPRVRGEHPTNSASKYEPLRDYLNARQHMPRVQLSFEQIAALLGSPLPKSAFEHRAWWSNQSKTLNRPQAAAWLGAGFVVASVGQDHGVVEFVRRERGGSA